MKTIKSIHSNFLASWYLILTMFAFMCLARGDLATASETQVFQDSFDTQGLFIEHFKPSSVAAWKVEDGVLKTVSAGSNNAVLNLPLEQNCKVEADVALLPGGAEGGFAGLMIDGCCFLIRPDGFWDVYRNEGDTRSSGSLYKRTIDRGKPYRLQVSRRMIDGGHFYSWSVDGEPLGSFSRMGKGGNTGESRLTLATSKIAASFDNVVVYRVEGGVASSNTLRNSSFEYLQDAIPLYWKGLNEGMLVDRYINHENFWKTFRVDPENPHSGKQSLRIETNEEVPQNGFRSHNTAVAKGAPFTWSIWLKANRKNVSAEMTVWEVFGRQHAKKIQVGAEWEKHSFTIQNPEKASVRAGVMLDTSGVVLWADDGQVEGGTATGDYSPSPADERFAQSDAAQKAPLPVKTHAIAEGTPVLDGQIGRDWANALVLEDFLIVESDKASKEKTTARLLCDRENLYLGFSCFTKSAKTLQAGSADALGKIAGGDCVEVFLDTAGDKKNFYHLFINPDAGTLSLDLKRNMGWNPAWQVKTSKHADRWEVEIRIPFKSLEISGARWGINLARHNPHNQEDSCTSRVGTKQFSDVSRYDDFTFPSAVSFPLAAKSAAKQPVENPFYTERNFYMNEPEAAVIASLPSGGGMTLRLQTEDGKTVWSRQEKARAGRNRFVIPLKGVADGNYLVSLDAGKSVPLVKRAFQANAVQIDQARRCLLVDGKPFFVFAPLVQAPLTRLKPSLEIAEKNLKYFADAGFQTVSIVSAISGEKPDVFWKSLLDYSDKLGLKVLAWPAGFTRPYFTRDVYTKLVADVREHPALLAWCVVDEPELYAKPEQVIEIHAEFRKLDPYHPLVMNNTIHGIPSRFAGLDTDLLSIDDYITNREGRTAREILEGVSMMEEVSVETRKPVLMFLAGSTLHNHYREPTAGEQVAQTYGSVIKGAVGIWHFLGMPSGPDHWAAFKRINDELHSLNDVLLSNEDAPTLTSDQSAVISMTRRLEGKTYLITANIENRPVNANFRLPDGTRAANVLFENRKIKLNDGVLRDSYEPYSRHVYVLESER